MSDTQVKPNNRAKVVARLQERLNSAKSGLYVTKSDTELVLKHSLAAVGEVLMAEDIGASLRTDIGTFVVKKTEERKGINPSNKQEITIPAKKRLSFRPNSKFKQDL